MKTVDFKYKAGIYKIGNTIDGRCYIGSAVNLYNRYHVHRTELAKGVHHSRHLQNFVNKYGMESLDFSVIELCKPAELIEREQSWIDLLHPAFNTAQIAGNTLGVMHTPETKKRMSQARRSRTDNGMRGKKHRDSTKELISQKRKARGLHPNFIAASIKANTGRKQSESEIARRALAQSKLGRTEVREIWWAAKLGVYQKDIARAYEVSQRLVNRVLHGIGIYAIYYELDKDYFDAQEQRFARHIAQPKLFEPVSVEMSQSGLFSDNADAVDFLAEVGEPVK